MASEDIVISPKSYFNFIVDGDDPYEDSIYERMYGLENKVFGTKRDFDENIQEFLKVESERKA